MREFIPRSHEDLLKPFITLTGIDRSVNIDQLIQLEASGAELGFLYTANREDRNRYIERDRAGYGQMRGLSRAALHVCGIGARGQLMLRYENPFEGLGDPYASWISELGSLGGRANLLRPVQRIQVNGHIRPGTVEQLCALYPHHIIITQHGSRADEDLLKVKATNHAILVDASGGTGKSPTEWRATETDKAVGFAGGLGPDNLAYELERIQKVARPGWWADMESKLRVDDWFSTERALRCAQIFKDNT